MIWRIEEGSVCRPGVNWTYTPRIGSRVGCGLEVVLFLGLRWPAFRVRYATTPIGNRRLIVGVSRKRRHSDGRRYSCFAIPLQRQR